MKIEDVFTAHRLVQKRVELLLVEPTNKKEEKELGREILRNACSLLALGVSIPGYPGPKGYPGQKTDIPRGHTS